MPLTAKARRRWFGGLCLLSALLLLATGELTPGRRLDGLAYVGYWMACFVLAALALLTAILDARALRREAREEQRALLDGTIAKIRADEAERTTRRAQKPPPESVSPR